MSVRRVSEEVALEAVHEATIRLYEAGSVPEKVDALLTTVAINVITDARRRSRLCLSLDVVCEERESRPLYLSSMPESQEPSPDDVVAQDEEMLRAQARCRSALGQLSKADGELLSAHYFGETAPSERDRRHGLRSGATKQALFRARLRLRRVLTGGSTEES